MIFFLQTEKGKFMIKIEGKYAEAVVYSEAIDSGSEGLIRALCNSILAEGSRIRVMCDVHPSKGCAVGMTMSVKDRIAPGLVGGDIGCGMTVVKVDAKRLELQKLDRVVRENIPAGSDVRKKPHRFCDRLDIEQLRCAHSINMKKAFASIGTLGGGNHFIELDKGSDGYYLVIHSGSRHLGSEVEKYYHSVAYDSTKEQVPYEFAYLEGMAKEDYLHDIRLVQEFAEINRKAIADEIIKAMKLDVTDEFSTVHNYIDTEAMILRKGAVSAKAGERLIIPLNMRDGCLLCIGKGNEEWNFSSPHGAGRMCSRAEVSQRFTLSQYKKEMAGVYTTSVSKDTLDECPMAYKNPQMIIDEIEPTVEICETIKSVYNFKSGR